MKKLCELELLIAGAVLALIAYGVAQFVTTFAG